MACWKLIFAAFLLLQIWASQATARILSDATSMVARHEEWMTQYGRSYKDDAEKAKRLEIFKKNVEYIEFFNAAGTRPYKLGVNPFADLTDEEFRATKLGYTMNSPGNSSEASSFKYASATELPSSIDWREKGAVTDVKNQHSCGCCWAFSAVAATEGINQITKGELISLSEQELVDCDTAVNQGCNGGSKTRAFEFIIQNNGLSTESDYPYEGVDGSTCRSKSESSRVVITGYETVPANSESALMQAVANQPVSVSIDAGGYDFRNYKEGVFNGECGTHLNHAVTAVGYGETSDGTKYWLVKNSWGTSWGENGYIKMQRDIDAAEGLCGLAIRPAYPTV